MRQKVLYDGALHISIRFTKYTVLKEYHYRYVDASDNALKRLQGWKDFSLDYKEIQSFDMSSVNLGLDGLTVKITQERVRAHQIERTHHTFSCLDKLRNSLEKAWSIGLVHGDLNRKNIWMTSDGFRVLDIEPLLLVPTSDGNTILRSTIPYICHSDYKNRKITANSDRLGFSCFSEWIKGNVRRPADATRCNPNTQN